MRVAWSIFACAHKSCFAMLLLLSLCPHLSRELHLDSQWHAGPDRRKTTFHFLYVTLQPVPQCYPKTESADVIQLCTVYTCVYMCIHVYTCVYTQYSTYSILFNSLRHTCTITPSCLLRFHEDLLEILLCQSLDLRNPRIGGMFNFKALADPKELQHLAHWIQVDSTHILYLDSIRMVLWWFQKYSKHLVLFFVLQLSADNSLSKHL